MLEKLYTLKEACSQLRLSARTVGEYTRRGHLGFINAKGKYLYPESALRVFLDRRSFPARHTPPPAKALRRSSRNTRVGSVQLKAA